MRTFYFRCFWVILTLTFFGFIVQFSILEEQTKRYKKTLEIVNDFYVDSIDLSVLNKTAMKALVSSLDPYSNYYDSSETAQREKNWKGISFAGIGANIQKRDSFVVVISLKEGYGAHQAGLKPGDSFTEINGNSVIGLSLDSTVKLLKGLPETTVFVKVRNGLEQEKRVEIQRKTLKVKTVPYWEFGTDEILYIRLDQFLYGTYNDFRMILDSVFKSTIPKGVILDLRGNNGGLVDETGKCIGAFVPKNTMYCKLKGKHSSSVVDYSTKVNPVDTTVPLIVMVSAATISSGEIMAGAFQDLDRAVVLGRKTYGKGLVQFTRYTGDGGSVYVTSARYYTPSGRSIHKIDYSKRYKDGKVENINDSLRVPFLTKNKRTVYSIGGVEPDSITEAASYGMANNRLNTNFLTFDFINYYCLSNPIPESILNVQIMDKTFNNFFDYCMEKEGKWNFESELTLNEISKQVKADFPDDSILDLENLRKQFHKKKEKWLEDHQAEITNFLKTEVIKWHFTSTGLYAFRTDEDEEIKTARNILKDSILHQELLRP